jgi:hypothetical protein
MDLLLETARQPCKLWVPNNQLAANAITRRVPGNCFQCPHASTWLYLHKHSSSTSRMHYLDYTKWNSYVEAFSRQAPIYVDTISGQILWAISCILNRPIGGPHLWPQRHLKTSFITIRNGGRWDQWWRINDLIVRWIWPQKENWWVNTKTGSDMKMSLLGSGLTR